MGPSVQEPSLERDAWGIDDFTLPDIAIPQLTDSEKHTSSKKTRRPPSGDHLKSMGNALNFFAKRSDPNESRYASENKQQEGDMNMPFSESDMRSVESPGGHSGDPRHRDSLEEMDPRDALQPQPFDGPTQREATRGLGIQAFSALRNPTALFRRALQPEGSATRLQDGAVEDGRKPRKLFTLFRKKNKEKDRRQDVADEDNYEDWDEDRETGERALNLVDSLFLGTPAINLLASCLCEDEYGIARAPLLMNLLGIKVTDISRSPMTKNKKFKIDLEYGVWPRRLKWSVEKTAKDLLYLHSRFKWLALRGALKSEDLPRYPVPPSLRRKDKKSRTQRNTASAALSQPASAVQQLARDLVESVHGNNDAHSVLSAQSFRDRLSTIRAHFSSDSTLSLHSESPEVIRSQMQLNQSYVQEIEKYLIDLNLLFAMRPQSNRLFQFFEISPISSLLTYESGYIGKQGVIHVGGTAKSQGWRVGHFKANDLKGMIDRRSEKWFLVRGLYVMYVSDIISTTPLEVFLVDSSFKITYKQHDKHDIKSVDTESDYEAVLEPQVDKNGQALSNVQHKVFKHLRVVLENSERKLVIIPKSRAEQLMWIKSLNDMIKNNVWAEKHRFGSFAPVRKNCFAQWLVDARDYFWALSSALEMAKDVVFIHDWWLSPELYLRRPAHGNQQFRIDRILQRIAQRGVKVFVIIYRNVGTTIPIDSLYTKHSILSLNQENIHVIRSPNQLLQNTYFWAHHEKVCVIDYNIAFLGGIDLCYGRYDTPDHVLADDSNIDFTALDLEKHTKDDFLNFRIFPGKDYSNTRVKDFSNLNKPYESLYDRNVVPRMPWHDIHMMTSGEIARDVSRHFVQRWNYLLRQKRPSRYTPLLTPPPDLTQEQMKELKLDGTCEVQMLRSAGNWLLGLKEREESIHTAYLKMIETSEHFIYIENQFFVTSCFIDGTEIKNRIGDALVDRIIRAHKEGTTWKAIILIPLVPGFESQVDQPDGSSVRVVMQCEYMSISRGASSLFAKLRKAGIEPDDYIQFFSLRKWGILGPDRSLVTEQLYIHAKCMIVDDRVAIIGSANINERSMRGSRDSEVAAIVRDTDTIESKMDGKPFKVGRFVHSLRLRLMREHLGVAVDLLDIVERRFESFFKYSDSEEGIMAATTDFKDRGRKQLSAAVELATRFVLQEDDGTLRWRHFCEKLNIKKQVFKIPQNTKFSEEPEPKALPVSFNNRTGPHEANMGIREKKKKHSFDPRVQNSTDHKRDVYGKSTDQYRCPSAQKARLDNVKFLRKLSREFMESTPDKAFLPDIENVRGFLELDDDDLEDNEESEQIIHARNKERWMLLKKIAYLQMVAARDAQQAEAEEKKRAAAGLPQTLVETAERNKPKDEGTTEAGGNDVEMLNTVNVKNRNPDLGDDIEVTHEPNGSEQNPAEMSAEQIPIVALDDSGFKDLIRKVNLPGVDSLSSFIDPYSFDDPLDPDFYEDVWFENARRNTDFFRMVFHCQPDDFVPTWKEYMQFMKLSKAFKVAQEGDANNRREKHLFDSDSLEMMSHEEVSRHARRSSQTTINISDYRNESGILGDVPGNDSKNETPKRPSSRTQVKVDKTISEDGEFDPDETNLPTTQETLDVDHDDTCVGLEEESESTKNDEKDEENPKLVMRETPIPNGESKVSGTEPGHGSEHVSKGPQRKRRAGAFSSRRKLHLGDKIFERDTAQRILQEIHGHLVLFPVDWLERELEVGNWFFNTDRLPPIEIYD